MRKLEKKPKPECKICKSGYLLIQISKERGFNNPDGVMTYHKVPCSVCLRRGHAIDGISHTMELLGAP